MSMSKRWMEEEQAAIRADRKNDCGCYFNFDDKFEVLCNEHQAEKDEADAEYQWSVMRDAAN